MSVCMYVHRQDFQFLFSAIRFRIQIISSLLYKVRMSI